MSRWSAEQWMVLQAMAGKVGVPDIARTVSKSETSVRVKASRENISLAVQRETPRGKRLLKEAA